MSKFWRQLGLNTLIGVAVEFTVIYLGALLFVDRHEPFWYAFMGFGLLYAFRIADWMMRLVTATAAYFTTKRQRISAVVALFYQHKVPVNDATRFADGDKLLEAIATSDDAGTQAKRFALMSLGAFNGIRQSSRFIGLMQAYSVLDAACERYRSVNTKSAA